MLLLKIVRDFKGVYIGLTTQAGSRNLRAVVLELPGEEDCCGWVFLARGIENMLFLRGVMKERGMQIVPQVVQSRDCTGKEESSTRGVQYKLKGHAWAREE